MKVKKVLMFIVIFWGIILCGCNNSKEEVEQLSEEEMTELIGSESSDKDIIEDIKNGSVIFSTEYVVEDFCNGCFIVSKSNGLLYGVLNQNGEEVIPIEYDRIYFLNAENVRRGIDEDIYIIVEYENTYKTFNSSGEKMFDFAVTRTTFDLGEADENSFYFANYENGILRYYSKLGLRICEINPFAIESIYGTGYDTSSRGIPTIKYISKNNFIICTGGAFFDANDNIIHAPWNLVLYDNKGNIVKMWENVSIGEQAFYEEDDAVVFVIPIEGSLYQIDGNGNLKEMGNINNQEKYFFSDIKGLTRKDVVIEENTYYLGKKGDVKLYLSNNTWKLVNLNEQPIYDNRYFECIKKDDAYFLLDENNMMCLVSKSGKMVIPSGYISWNGFSGYFNNVEITNKNFFVGYDCAAIVTYTDGKSEIHYFYAE